MLDDDALLKGLASLAAHTIRAALEDITLADLGHPPREFPPLKVRPIRNSRTALRGW